MKYYVKKTGKTFSIFSPTNELVEGGFFIRHAAEEACAEWNRGTRNT